MQGKLIVLGVLSLCAFTLSSCKENQPSSNALNTNSSNAVNATTGDAKLLVNPDPAPTPLPAPTPAPGTPSENPTKCYVKNFVQPALEITKSVDILFVVDSSGSMYDKHEKMANQIEAYVKQLNSNVDYRIGVLLGHSSRSSYSGKVLGIFDSKKMPLDNSSCPSKGIKWNLKNLLLNSPSDFYADGGELGLFSLKSAVTSKLIDNQKAGFFRDEAALSVVFVTDENDVCAEYPKGVSRVRDLDSYKGMPLEIWSKNNFCEGISPNVVFNALKDLKKDQPLSVNGIVYNDVKKVKQSTPGNQKEDELAYGILDIISLSNGRSVDITAASYVDGLKKIGELTASKMTIYDEVKIELENLDESSIKVFVDKDQTTFTWKKDSKIVFIPNAGSSNSVVEVQYCEIPPIVTPPSDPGNGGGTGGGTTPPSDPNTDVNPHDPAISQFATIGFDSAMTVDSAFLIWQTDNLSTSRVVWGETDKLGNTSNLDSTVTTSHTITITGLKPATTYFFQAVSVNPAGVVSYSPIIMKSTK